MQTGSPLVDFHKRREAAEDLAWYLQETATNQNTLRAFFKQDPSIEREIKRSHSRNQFMDRSFIWLVGAPFILLPFVLLSSVFEVFNLVPYFMGFCGLIVLFATSYFLRVYPTEKKLEKKIQNLDPANPRWVFAKHVADPCNNEQCQKDLDSFLAKSAHKTHLSKLIEMYTKIVNDKNTYTLQQERNYLANALLPLVETSIHYEMFSDTEKAAYDMCLRDLETRMLKLLPENYHEMTPEKVQILSQ